ncbi:hypothetical protein [Pseudogemmobacter sonorensis]|uniref:hypothetical protein n=1 Tax=Pseudogemmobacter sonorensis TaxID=2989681 RepID=UPI0036B92798
MRKVIVWASLEWLNRDGAGFLAALPPEMASGGIARDVFARLVELISQITRPQEMSEPLAPLCFEGRAIQVV